MVLGYTVIQKDAILEINIKFTSLTVLSETIGREKKIYRDEKNATIM